MVSKCRSRRSWFARRFNFFDNVSECCARRGRLSKATLALQALETRIVPATTFLSYEAVGVIGKTYSVVVQRSSIGSDSTTPVNGSIDWGDTSSTPYSGWYADVPSKVYTHTYGSKGDVTIQTKGGGGAGEDSHGVHVKENKPGAMECSGPDCQTSVIDEIIATPNCVGGPAPGISPKTDAITPPNNDPGIIPDAGFIDHGNVPDCDPGFSINVCGPSAGGPQNNSPIEIPRKIDDGSEKIRTEDGLIKFLISDIASGGYGLPWSDGRSWSNGDGYDGTSDIGNGWVENQLPSIIQIDTGTVALVSNASTARFFDESSSVFTERFGGFNHLSYNSGSDEYTLLTPDGVTFKFAGFGSGYGDDEKGRFISRTDRYGDIDEVYTRNGDGCVTEIRRGGGAEVWDYAYLPSGDNAGKLASVEMKRGGTTYRKAEYSYYGSSDTYGNLGDLQKVFVKDGSGNTLGTQYYRYYKPGEADGYAGALKMYLGYASYERAAANLSNVLTASDGSLDDYADLYLKFDSSRRVKSERIQGAGCSMCSGGIGEYSYTYSTSSNSAGFNSWQTKTIETMPDNNRNVIYTNAYGQIMLNDTQAMSGASVTGHWPTFYHYNSDGRLDRVANPSAFTLSSGNYYSDTNADLLGFVSGASAYLADSAGLITNYAYGSSTTASTSSAGNVAGYLQSVSIQRGETSTAIPEFAQNYIARSNGTLSIYAAASQTIYSDTAGSSSITTSYAYDWDSTNKFAVNSETVTRPVVTTAQHGPNSADVEYYVTGAYGNVTWMKDAAGALTYRTYDAATGGVTKRISDVNTSLGTTTGGYTSVPSIGGSTWSTPSAFGVHSVTTYTFDFLGRVLTATDPLGHVSYVVYKDTDHEMRVYPAWDTSLYSSKGGPTGPITVARIDRAHQYSEVLTMSAEPDRDGSGHPKASEAITSMESLTRNHVNVAGQMVRTDAYFEVDDVTYGTSPILNGPSSENRHYSSYTDYDDRGWLKRTETPNGTITRYIHDALGRLTEVWIGTDDTPTGTGTYWPVTTTGTDLVKVQSYTYDAGGMGDSNLTSSSQYPNGTTGVRTTLYAYDWRDRLVATKSGAETGTESTSVNRPVTYVVYDNLNRRTESRLYDGDGVNIYTDSTSDGVPDAPSSSLLRGKSVAYYDNQSRVYRTQIIGVDQYGESGDLTTEVWYDRRGFVIKSLSPTGLVQKTTYDGLGRPIARYVTDGGGDGYYSDADDVTDDTVYEQSKPEYDKASNLLYATSWQRFHDATSTGELSSSNARVSYSAMFYDQANRLTATANYGTNGGATWSKPTSVPSRSDTVLVTSQTYDSAGRLLSVTDPRGIESRSSYDALGRTIITVQAFYGIGAINDDSPSLNKTTEFAYDGSGHLTMYKAWLNESDYELTEYDYGVTAGSDGNTITSNDLLRAILYPDPSTVGASIDHFAYSYDALGERVRMSDKNRTQHTYSFDLVGRPTSDAITDYHSIDNSVLRLTTEYDTYMRAYRFTSWDSATGGSEVNQVVRLYDAFGQISAEYQKTNGAVDEYSPVVQYTYGTGTQSSLLLAMTYPNGYEVDYTYDGVGRLSEVSSADVNESYDYLGLGTVVRRGGDVVNQLLYDGSTTGDAGDQYAGLDRFGRVVDLTWTADSTRVDHFKYGYDRNGNRLYRTNELNHDFDELYHASGVTTDAGRYDSLNQLTAFERGPLSNSNASGEGSDDLLDTVSAPSRSQAWTVDGLGNFGTVTTDSTAESRTHDLQNKLTAVGSNSLSYDDMGNMTQDDQSITYTYDGWNRMIGVGSDIGRYAYDALGRRVKEGDHNHWLYYSKNWQVLEEVADDAVTHQYVWSPVYVDALVARLDYGGISESSSMMVGRDTFTSTSSSWGVVQVLYALQDANFNVTALVDGSGDVVERFVYDPYGRFDVLANDWSAKSGGSDYGWLYLHQGGRWDEDAGLFSFRNRDYSPRLMRWVEMDPITTRSGDVNFYRSFGNSPEDSVDPFGLRPDWDAWQDAKDQRYLKEWEKTYEKIRQKAAQDRNKKVLDKLDKMDCCPKEDKEKAKQLLEGVLNGADFEWPHTTGVFGKCMEWVDDYTTRNSKLLTEVGLKASRCFKVDSIIWETHNIATDFLFGGLHLDPFTGIDGGLIPLLTFNQAGTNPPAHTAIRISFCDGTFYYLDDGNYGGPGHGFDPGSIPPGRVPLYDHTTYGPDPYHRCGK
ncbi:MAG: RHS repeat-associated core domain-containing protein [Gemmataceae bacterium]